MTMDYGSRSAASQLLVHAPRRSKSVRIVLSAADFDGSPFQMPAKPRLIPPLKSRFTDTMLFATPPRVVANRRFSFLD
jgi:hypothetical protein